MTAAGTAAADAADPGLQAQRTVLAWRRTAVAVMANAVLLLHAALDSGRRPAALAPLAAVVALTVAALVCVRRGQTLSRHPDGGPQDARANLAITVAVAGVACTVAALAVCSWIE